MFHNRDVPQLTPAIQGDHQKIENTPTEPVPDAVFALAGDAWAVSNRYLFDNGSSALSQNGHEAVNAVESR